MIFKANGAPGGQGYFLQGGNTSMTRAEWKLAKGCKWVRGLVKDQEGKYAWTNPIIVEKQT